MPLLGNRVTTRMALAGFALAAAAGCGKSAEPQEVAKTALQVQPVSATVKQGTTQTTQGIPQLPLSPGKAVDFEALKALLPDIDGWTKTDARGEQVTLPVATSRAEARYRKDDSSIELTITDSALSPLLIAPKSMFLTPGYAERSDEGFKQAAKVGGHPGFEEWNTDSRRGEVTAVVANRFIVEATGHDVPDLAVVRMIIESVSLSRLASLK